MHVLSSLIDSSSADMRQLVGHSGPVYGTAFSPDNTFLLSASEDGTSTYSTVSRLNTQSCANNIVLSPDCLTLLRQMSYKFLFSFVVFVFQFGCGACRRLLLWCVSRDTTTLSGVCSLGRSLCSIEYTLSLSLTHMHTIHVHVHNINFIIPL